LTRASILVAAFVVVVGSPSRGIAAPALQPAPEIGLGALQLGAGLAVEIGGMAGLLAARIYPKTFGIQSDYANLVFVIGVVPGLAGGAVCATGLLSRSYRGRCLPTFLGAYAGAILGGLLGVAAAPSPGPDDSSAFVESVFGIIGVAVGAPIGAVVGYHLGKQPIAPATPQATATAIPSLDRSDVRSSPESRADGVLRHPPRALLLPVVDVRW
jgi:hypothetical protein